MGSFASARWVPIGVDSLAGTLRGDAPRGTGNWLRRSMNSDLDGDVDEGVPYGTRLTQIAAERPDDVAVTTVAPDGGERVLTLSQLESGANRWGRELAASGAKVGSY